MVEYEHVYVKLERDEDGYPPYETEEVCAEKVGDHLFRIVFPPVFVYGMAPGDIVRTVTDEDHMNWVVKVAKCSDKWLSRICVRDESRTEEVIEQFQKMGCEATPTPYGLLTVVVPAEVPATPVLEALKYGEDVAGMWYHDLGVRPS